MLRDAVFVFRFHTHGTEFADPRGRFTRFVSFAERTTKKPTSVACVRNYVSKAGGIYIYIHDYDFGKSFRTSVKIVWKPITIRRRYTAVLRFVHLVCPSLAPPSIWYARRRDCKHFSGRRVVQNNKFVFIINARFNLELRTHAQLIYIRTTTDGEWPLGARTSGWSRASSS